LTDPGFKTRQADDDSKTATAMSPVAVRNRYRTRQLGAQGRRCPRPARCGENGNPANGNPPNGNLAKGKQSAVSAAPPATAFRRTLVIWSLDPAARSHRRA
jgi:hypothetical protein